jgi:hypothetical protein
MTRSPLERWPARSCCRQAWTSRCGGIRANGWSGSLMNVTCCGSVFGDANPMIALDPRSRKCLSAVAARPARRRQPGRSAAHLSGFQLHAPPRVRCRALDTDGIPPRAVPAYALTASHPAPNLPRGRPGDRTLGEIKCRRLRLNGQNLLIPAGTVTFRTTLTAACTDGRRSNGRAALAPLPRRN